MSLSHMRITDELSEYKMRSLFARTNVAVAASVALIATPLVTFPASAVTHVGDEFTLRTALTAGQDITLTGNITLTSPIELPASYSGTIDGAGNTVTGAMGDPNDHSKPDQFGMFIVQGNVTVKNLTVDGASKWRPFWVKDNSTLNLNAGTTLTRGMTNAPQGDGGGVLVGTGATLNMNGATISDSHGSEAAVNGSGQGGGVATRPGATVNGVNCTFTNNHTNHSDATNGGAIFMALDGRLTLDGCTFSGNSTRNIRVGGNQGGAIYVSDRGITEVKNSTFNVARGFNTGGAIRTLGGSLHIHNSHFTIDNLGDGFGISGGALAVESTHTIIEGSTFTATQTSKVYFAGGLIDVVGSQPATVKDGYPHGFTLRGSTLTGAGSWWNGPSIATYGGAIAFESGPTTNNTYTALIDSTTIRNVTTDENGGAITIGTKKGEAGGSVNVTLRNSTIDNTRTRFAWKNTFGGGIYVAPGHTLTLEGNSSIKNTFSVLGGGIYNDGTVLVTDGSTVTNNAAYRVGGGIYNDGVLKVDDARLSGNSISTDNGAGYISKNSGADRELSGANIYAHKDVTLTPQAVFDDGDIRVLDTASNILLTGSLDKKINVSISEKPLARPYFPWDEADRRYIGYTVAKGTGGYTPTRSDAQFLHYVTVNGSDPATYEDHTSVGTWDYIAHPDAASIVLGQRAKMVYHSNQGTFDKNSCQTATHTTPQSETKEQLFWIYSSVPHGYTVDPDRAGVTTIEPSEVTPCRGDASFAGWYSVTGPHAGAKNTVAQEDKFNVSQFFGAANTKTDGKITTILDKKQLDAYAGWKANVEVTYEYASAHASDASAPTFPQILKDKATAFNKTGGQAPQIGSDIPAFNPDPTSEKIDGFKWVFTKWTKEGADVHSTAVSNIQDAHHFVGLWRVQLTKTHEFTSATAGKNLPDSVTVLTPGQGGWQEFGSTFTPSENFAKEVKVADGIWKFRSWNKNEVLNAKSNQHFVGSWEFEALPPLPVTFTVDNCTWADGSTDNIVKHVTVTRQGDTLSGLLGDVIPSGMKPAAGYEGGAWKTPAPTPNTPITKATTFTYSCSKILHATHEFKSETGKALPQAIVDATPVSFDFSHGTNVVPGGFVGSLRSPFDVMDGTWFFLGWDKESVQASTADQHFIGTWRFTPLAPIPVTYKVVNCAWNDGTTVDKVENVTVTRKASGIDGTLGTQIPTGMKPAAGYEGGAWKTPAPSSDTVISHPTTFTYACSPIPAPPTLIPPKTDSSTPGKLAATGSTVHSTLGTMALLVGFGGAFLAFRRHHSA